MLAWLNLWLKFNSPLKDKKEDKLGTQSFGGQRMEDCQDQKWFWKVLLRPEVQEDQPELWKNAQSTVLQPEGPETTSVTEFP